jgi:hypothetical protein
LQELNNWLLSNRVTLPTKARVVTDQTKMGRWLFQGIQGQAVYSIETAPALTFLKLLAPFVGIHPTIHIQQLQAHLRQSGIPEQLPYVTAADAKTLIKALFGGDFQESTEGVDFFPRSPKDIRAWAVFFEDGHLWFSTEDWLEGGAFHVQLPQEDASRSPGWVPTFRFGWDQCLRDYTAHTVGTAPLLLSWPRRNYGFESHFTALEQSAPLQEPNRLIHNLMTDPSLALLHLVDAPRSPSNHQPVYIKIQTPLQTRTGASAYAASSAVMSQAEAWLGAMRFQSAFPRQAAHSEKLVSVVMTSLSSISLQPRLLRLLTQSEEMQTQAGSLLEFYEEGELLLDDLRTLLACSTLQALTHAHSDTPPDLSEPNTLYLWVSRNENPTRGREWSHRLNYYVNSTMVFPETVLLSQSIDDREYDKGRWHCGPLNMGVDVNPKMLQVRGPSISVQLDTDEDAERLAQMQDRATAQSSFWRHMLCFEESRLREEKKIRPLF